MIAVPNQHLHTLPGPDNITREILKNGITVLARSNFNSPSVFITGYLSVGSLFEPDEKLGLANFTVSALMRGTAYRDFQQIYAALENVGASLVFGSSVHTTAFGGNALAEDLELLLELLSQALRSPVFPPEHIERLRAMHLTGLAIRAQDTEEMASLTLDQIIYQNHPYSRPEDGYPETISNITRQDIVNFHQQFYGPKNMAIAIVGAVEPKQGVEKVAEFFEDWGNPLQPEPTELPAIKLLDKSIKKVITIPGKSQADIKLGVPGPSRCAPEYLVAAVGNHILGQFGMYGRIGEKVREKAGLAYYAYSSLSGGLGPGPWSISAGVDQENVERVIQMILEEIDKFTSEHVTEDELSDSQANLMGRLPLSLESNAGVASAIINLERYNLGLDYYLRYQDLIQAITVNDILTTAQKFLNPQKIGIAVAGP